ncbi:conserved exported hypothetical protein [Agrobacterium tumefaciens str. Kerr 14]|uniref:L,D-TPase catalytic domain-containing protein n=1 Tax=Agrobacterium tumefaciens str. Kerr 14 TaxID=1183424 RepID=A0A1S7SCT0_AGRTU|nr:conserved exported hypothetical protein [Agrobacterium tumefaciens str. Kerr 14]
MNICDTLPTLSRRVFILGTASAAVSLAGCAATTPTRTEFVAPVAYRPPEEPQGDVELEARYASLVDGGHVIPAVPYKKMDPKYYRQRVADPTGETPGTVVVDTPSRFLYLVESGGTAMRYGVGIGRMGFAWEGEGIIHWRQHWPRWKPPSEMIARRPELEKYSVANGGMDPGVQNPLGARALLISTES